MNVVPGELLAQLLYQLLSDVLLPLVNMKHIEVLGPVDMVQKIDDGMNILVDKQSKAYSCWQYIPVFVAIKVMLMQFDIIKWS